MKKEYSEVVCKAEQLVDGLLDVLGDAVGMADELETLIRKRLSEHPPAAGPWKTLDVFPPPEELVLVKSADGECAACRLVGEKWVPTVGELPPDFVVESWARLFISVGE